MAETKHPISNLQQAEIAVMVPDAFIDQRRKELLELPSGLPDSYKLGEGVYASLFSDTWWAKKPYPPFRSFEKLALFLADRERGNTRIDTIPPVRPSVIVEKDMEKVSLTVVRPYFNVAMPNARSITTTIKLARVAGYTGYGKPDISRTVDVASNPGVRP